MKRYLHAGWLSRRSSFRMVRGDSLRKGRLVAAIAVVGMVVAACSSNKPATSGSTSGPAPSTPAKKIKVALILPGFITDAGTMAESYQGLKDAEAQYGIDVAYTEGVKAADIATTAEGYARDGYDLIVATGEEFSAPIQELASKFPDTTFDVLAGVPAGTIPPNVGFVTVPIAPAGYAIGALMALMSKTHNIGVVGGADIPVQQEITNAFKLGAEQTVPGTRAQVVITGDYDDAAKGGDAAKTIIGNGADVLWHVANVTGVGAIKAANDAGVLIIGCYADQSDLAPDHVATSMTFTSKNLVTASIREFVKGTPILGQSPVRLEDTWVAVWHTSDHNPALITDDIWAKFLQVFDDLTNNKIDLSSVIIPGV
jgi:basic membrane protein A